MPDAIAFTADGRVVSGRAGATVAAALEGAGVRAMRSSVGGEPRGVLCGMGICFECRVAIDGVPHRRACMEPCRPGMAVITGEDAVRMVPPPAGDLERETRVCDVAVVGAGPSGVAAACRAAERGAAVILMDDGLGPGGQIYRHLPGRPAPAGVRSWTERLARSGAVFRPRAEVFDAVYDAEGGFRLDAATPAGTLRVRARAVVLATGARELFLPFPGWTLPGVMGAGGAQALWKSGASLAGRVAVVAGSGPLLLPVAASLAKAGARVAAVAEQASRAALARFAAGLLRFPGKLAEGARLRRAFAGSPYRTGTWVAEAHGDGQLEAVTVTDGRRRRRIACDLAAVGWGLVPGTELARLLGCRLSTRAGGLGVDAGSRQETSVPGVFASGEPCGIAGVDAAIARGQIAGLAAAAHAGAGTPVSAREGRALARAGARGDRLARSLARTFTPRPALRRLARPDTIVCRCEDVRLEGLGACAGAREAKLATRAGMGACQGRVCGPALEFLFGWDSDSVRPPVRPTAIAHLIAPEETA